MLGNGTYLEVAPPRYTRDYIYNRRTTWAVRSTEHGLNSIVNGTPTMVVEEMHLWYVVFSFIHSGQFRLQTADQDVMWAVEYMLN